MKKNSIFEMLKDPENYNTALIPCEESECADWNNGGCFYMRKVGK